MCMHAYAGDSDADAEFFEKNECPSGEKSAGTITYLRPLPPIRSHVHSKKSKMKI